MTKDTSNKNKNRHKRNVFDKEKNPYSFIKLMSMGKNDDVATPEEFYEHLNRKYNFDFDPCPLNAGFDGLSIPWGARNYVNPPFSRIKPWIEKAVAEMDDPINPKFSLFLITTRTNCKYWHEFIFPRATNITFINRGIKFDGYKTKIPVPLALIEFDPKKSKFSKFRKVSIGTQDNGKIEITGCELAN